MASAVSAGIDRCEPAAGPASFVDAALGDDQQQHDRRREAIEPSGRIRSARTSLTTAGRHRVDGAC